jgi:hypothetical protein
VRLLFYAWIVELVAVELPGVVALLVATITTRGGLTGLIKASRG